jgi:hypothetical protein
MKTTSRAEWVRQLHYEDGFTRVTGTIPTRAPEVFAPFLAVPPADPVDQPGEVELGVSAGGEKMGGEIIIFGAECLCAAGAPHRGKVRWRFAANIGIPAEQAKALINELL